MQPTIVNNVESVSNLPWIVLNSGEAFKGLGQGRSTGTRIFSLSGHVRQPANYEIEMSKTTFHDLIYDPKLGGGIRNDNQLKAFIPGGASAPWFGPDQLDMGLDQDAVGKAGSMLGSGSVIVMDHTTCMVRASWRITRFFHRESCGQCTPCREGGGWLDKILHRIETGAGTGVRPRPSPRRVRQHRPRFVMAAAKDNDLRPRPVDPVLHHLGHQDVPRRVPRPHQGRWLSIWLTGPRRRSRRSPSRSTARRSRPARARWSSPRPNGAASTSPGSAGTPGCGRSGCAGCAWSRSRTPGAWAWPPPATCRWPTARRSSPTRPRSRRRRTASSSSS